MKPSTYPRKIERFLAQAPSHRLYEFYTEFCRDNIALLGFIFALEALRPSSFKNESIIFELEHYSLSTRRHVPLSLREKQLNYPCDRGDRCGSADDTRAGVLRDRQAAATAPGA